LRPSASTTFLLFPGSAWGRHPTRPARGTARSERAEDVRSQRCCGRFHPRFLAVDEFLWLSEVADVLRDRLGDRAAKVPKRNAPNILIGAPSLFDVLARTPLA